MHDVIIIGAGPAGLAAGIYSGRFGLKTLVLEKQLAGGQLFLTESIENYPGFKKPVSSSELGENMRVQAETFGAKIISEEVKEISGKSPFKVKTDDNTYESKAIIIATGVLPKTLNVPGEDKLRARGISYCGICDAPLFKDKDIVVVGGGNTAAEEALLLARFAKSIKLLHRRDELRAVKILEKRIFDEPKIEILWSTVAEEFIGEDKLKSVKIKNVKTQKIITIPADGAFIFVGAQPQTSFLKKTIKLDTQGFIKTKEDFSTSCRGIFAVGDCRSNAWRQVVVACSEGAQAANSAYNYILTK